MATSQPSIAIPFPGNPSMMLDINDYKARNPELQVTLGNDPNAYLKHYVEVGARLGYKAKFFDLNNYIASSTNPDLAPAGITTIEKGRQHYLSTVIAEPTRKLGVEQESQVLSTADQVQIASVLGKTLDANSDGKVTPEEFAAAPAGITKLLAQGGLGFDDIAPIVNAFAQATANPSTNPTNPTTGTQTQQPPLPANFAQQIANAVQMAVSNTLSSMGLGGGSQSGQGTQGQLTNPGTGMTGGGMTGGGGSSMDPYSQLMASNNQQFAQLGQQVNQGVNLLGNGLVWLGGQVSNGFNMMASNMNSLNSKLDMLLNRMNSGMSTMGSMQSQMAMGQSGMTGMGMGNSGMQSQFGQMGSMNNGMMQQNPFGNSMGSMQPQYAMAQSSPYGSAMGMGGNVFSNTTNYNYNYGSSGGFSAGSGGFQYSQPQMQPQQMAFSQPVRPMQTAMPQQQMSYSNPMAMYQQPRTWG